MRLIKRTFRKDHVGECYGNLEITAYAGHLLQKNGKFKDIFWRCQCSCGNEKNIRWRSLKNCTTKTCGSCPKPHGKNHYAWEGCGDFSKNLYTSYYHGAKARGLEFRVSIEYLWELYEKQNGKCALTGWKIDFAPTFERQKDGTVSLDRIDSTKGYLKSNVQWVHKKVNYIKSNTDNKFFIEMCQAIAKNNK